MNVALPTPLRVLSLCSGVGGLDLGLKLALGDGCRTVGYVEREAYAAAVLVARMGDKALDEAPIWDDLTTFDGRPWRGAVDLVLAGFPCQPWSNAGARRGTDDERWLWPLIEKVLREVEPSYVFLENVPGLVSGGGLGQVLGGLASLGFDAEWTVLGAEDIGAPHRRDRVFILAYRDLWRTSGDGRQEPPHRAGSVGDPDLTRPQGRSHANGDPNEPPSWPPGPEERDRWANLLSEHPELAPAVESSLRGTSDGSAPRVDRLRALGNGVVPAQAAFAFRVLWGRLV